MKPITFQKKILAWFNQYGRHDLPWQKNTTPYRVWISEIMLQQTQVNTVIPYYQKFMRRFPNVKVLALAPQDEVLAHWSGLGYYARARNLHKAANIIHSNFKGQFPDTVLELMELPGIGRSTAGAIISLSMQKSAAILDGNVKRVLTRFFAIAGSPVQIEVLNNLWNIAEQYTPKKKTHDYNQAMMDLGATLCTRSKPRCMDCPLQHNCIAYQTETQANYPNKKQKVNRPLKEIFMLVIQNKNGEILLEKRPPTGIWGGLWSLPEYAHHNIKTALSLPLLRHQFSHFELTIKPLLVKAESLPPIVMESREQVWYKLSSILPGGIAAPIAKILQSLEQLK